MLIIQSYNTILLGPSQILPTKGHGSTAWQLFLAPNRAHPGPRFFFVFSVGPNDLNDRAHVKAQSSKT